MLFGLNSFTGAYKCMYNHGTSQITVIVSVYMHKCCVSAEHNNLFFFFRGAFFQSKDAICR